MTLKKRQDIVKVKLFMDINKPIDKKELRSIIETREFEMPVHGGGVNVDIAEVFGERLGETGFTGPGRTVDCD